METFIETRAAVLSCKKYNKPIYVILKLTEEMEIQGDTSPLSALIALQSLNIAGFGLSYNQNPSSVCDIISELEPYAEIPLIASISAGEENLLIPNLYSISPAVIGKTADEILNAGAKIICTSSGITPEHTLNIKNEITHSRPIKKSSKNVAYSDLLLSNGIDFYSLDDERLEFTEQIECTYDMAESLITAEEQSFDVLSVVVNSVDDAMEFYNNAALSSLPVSFYSNNADALKTALFLYCGRCLVDSKSELPEYILADLAKEYGAVVY